MNNKLTLLKAFKNLREQNDFLKQRNIPREYRYDDELDIIETALKEYETHKKILKDYGLSLANFREACLLLAMLKGEHLNIHNIANQLKSLEIIKECFDFNGFEEFIPNSKWYQSESKQKLLKEVLL